MAMSDSLITSDTDTLTEEDIRPVTEMYYDIEQDKLLGRFAPCLICFRPKMTKPATLTSDGSIYRKHRIVSIWILNIDFYDSLYRHAQFLFLAVNFILLDSDAGRR